MRRGGVSAASAGEPRVLRAALASDRRSAVPGHAGVAAFSGRLASTGTRDGALWKTLSEQAAVGQRCCRCRLASGS